MEKITILGRTMGGYVILGYDVVEENETEFDIERRINNHWNYGSAWFLDQDDLVGYEWRYGEWTEEDLKKEE